MYPLKKPGFLVIHILYLFYNHKDSPSTGKSRNKCHSIHSFDFPCVQPPLAGSWENERNQHHIWRDIDMQQLPKQPSTVTKSSRNQAAPDSPKCIGIGTLGEKSLHQYLKNYLEPDPSLHEVPIGRYVGDIVNSQGVIEIQTGGFHPLKKKLAYYLSDPSLAGKTVTVACPRPAIKWLIWIDPDSGLTTQRRRSPKRTQPWEICRQLIYLLELLHHPALRFRLLMMEWEEFRCQNGWGRDGKRGSQRYERIPLRILEELSIDCAHPESFRILLPPGLPELFTVKDIMKAGKASRRLAQQMIQVLKAVRLVELKGKEGRCHLYACIRPSESGKTGRL